MVHNLRAFPRAWLWLVDEIIPSHVKEKYSPRESWKGKPFSKEDSRFFFKGIDELSTLFTDERPKGMPQYFAHPKYRSAYLLYFLPLQAAKFLALFQTYPQAIRSMLESARKSGVLRIADLGVGPGTGSLSVLLTLLDLDLGSSSGSSSDLGLEDQGAKGLPQVELYWFDTQESIMADGVALVEKLSSQFPKLRGRVKVFPHVMPWWKAAAHLPKDLSLLLMGHLLNEAPATRQPQAHSLWKDLLSRTSGGGTLLLEPATRKNAQNLSQLRNFLLESEILSSPSSSSSSSSPSPSPGTLPIWGPCLHTGTCPLSEGRDWCHVSVPIQIPGKWFREFSHGLGSERNWAKFTYLWLASQSFPAPKPDVRLRRVISDPLERSLDRGVSQKAGQKIHSHRIHDRGSSTGSPGGKTTVLICEPETAGRLPVSTKSGIIRGDLVKTK